MQLNVDWSLMQLTQHVECQRLRTGTGLGRLGRQSVASSAAAEREGTAELRQVEPLQGCRCSNGGGFSSSSSSGSVEVAEIAVAVADLKRRSVPAVVRCWRTFEATSNNVVLCTDVIKVQAEIKKTLKIVKT